MSKGAGTAKSPLLTGPTRHFLYFRSKPGSETAAGAAKRIGPVEGPKERDGKWLVIVSDPSAEPSAIDETSKKLASIATANGGEYDGWEAGVSSPSRTDA
jgi:hypothetical protein